MAGELLNQVSTAAAERGLETAAHERVKELRAARKPIPGFGHPLHKDGDPRVQRLFQVAAALGTAGRHIEAARAVEKVLPELTGKNLRLNVSAAIPAVLLDAGYPLLALKGAPLLARAAGLIGHLLEEQTHPIGFRMSHAAAAAIQYNGPAPDGFVPDEN
jgi:citrate synthase